MDKESLQALGGKARATALSQFERSEIARNAANTRWKSSAYRKSEGFTIPLPNGAYVRVPRMSEEEWDIMMETLKLWKKMIIKVQETAQTEEAAPIEDPPK